jgi:hypothetical protein
MLGPREFSCKSLALSHRHAIEYPDSSVPRLATRGTILRRSSHVQRSNAPADGLRSMSVMGACAYFRAAELTVYGFPHLVSQSLTVLFRSCQCSRKRPYLARREGCSRPLVPRIMFGTVLSHPSIHFVLYCSKSVPKPMAVHLGATRELGMWPPTLEIACTRRFPSPLMPY